MTLSFSLVCGRYSVGERGALGIVRLTLIRKETPAEILLHFFSKGMIAKELLFEGNLNVFSFELMYLVL